MYLQLTLVVGSVSALALFTYVLIGGLSVRLNFAWCNWSEKVICEQDSDKYFRSDFNSGGAPASDYAPARVKTRRDQGVFPYDSEVITLCV